MTGCTNADNPDITGRGVVWSFYLQGLLMVLNGLLGIEQQDISPSIITILVICVTLLYQSINEPSIYLSLILHLLLCFHVLASHAVIVIEFARSTQNNGDGTSTDWSGRYHILQLAGFVILASSVYFGIVLKRCDLGILGFVGTKGFSIEWFAPAVILPYIFSALVTLLLGDYLKANPPTQTPQSRRGPGSTAYTLLGTVWMTALVFTIILLESTLRGNVRLGTPSNSSTAWTFGQILPLVLNITPLWMFMTNSLTRLNNSKIKDEIWPKIKIFTVPHGNAAEPPSIVTDLPEQSNTPTDTNSNSDAEGPLTGSQTVPPAQLSMFVGARHVQIHNGHFVDVQGDLSYRQTKFDKQGTERV